MYIFTAYVYNNIVIRVLNATEYIVNTGPFFYLYKYTLN